MSTLGIVILVLLALLFLGTLPRWNYSSSWGYGPSGAVGLLLAIMCVLVFIGEI